MPRRFFIWTAVIGLLIDQLSKLLVLRFLREGAPVRIAGEFLRLIWTRNPDGIFGLQFGPAWVYYVLPVVGMGLVLYFALRSDDRWFSVSYGMVLGGALGNLVDRVRFGHVIDFIDVGTKGWRWYTFNPADALIICGIILLLGRELLTSRRRAATAPAQPSDEPGLPRQ